MSLPPPRSTLFPYTTLFRSADKYDYAVFSNMAHQEDPQSNIAVFRKFRTALKPSGALLISDFVLNDDRDRKSTRLNSSHANNSYAGFCLKKKKDLRGSRQRR